MSLARYICPWCNTKLTHTDARKHWETICTKRPGSTVKAPAR